MGGTQIYIEAGSKVKIEDLIKGIGIASANDAAVSIAEFSEKTGIDEDILFLQLHLNKDLMLKHFFHFHN